MDVQNEYEPAAGDAVEVVSVTDDACACASVVAASPWLTEQRLTELERKVAEHAEHLQGAAPPAEQPTEATSAAADAEPDALDAMDTPVAVYLIDLVARLMREVPERKVRAAVIEEAEAMLPGFTLRLPRSLRGEP